MKKLITSVVMATVLVAASGCATRGAGFVPLVDTKGRDPVQLSIDIQECQSYARQTADAASGAVMGAIAGALLGAALSHKQSYQSSAISYGAGVGALSGAGSANESQETVIRRCLAGRSWNVLN